MGDRRKVFLARNSKTNFHSLFEVIPGDYSAKTRGVLDPETMNALARWKNIDELVAVLEKTGPLIASDIYKEANRLIPIADAVEIAEAGGRGRACQGFGFNDGAFLRMQLYLDGHEGPYPFKAAIARGIANHGLLESGAVEDLRAWAKEDPGAKVAIEPIADIVFMRNLCSVCLRILANLQSSDADNALEASGFVRVERERKWWISSKYRDSYYVIPLHHNAVDDMTINFSWKWGRNVFSYMVIDPLDRLIHDQRADKAGRNFGSVSNAVTLTSPVVTGKGGSIFNFGYDYENEDTRTYLGIEDDIPQAEAAERFTHGVALMFKGLKTKEGEPIGWDCEEIPPASVNAGPEPVFRSLASTMVGTLFYRAGTMPATCKNCGNGMLVQSKGRRKGYCSDSCRAQLSASKVSGNG